MITACLLLSLYLNIAAPKVDMGATYSQSHMTCIFVGPKYIDKAVVSINDVLVLI